MIYPNTSNHEKTLLEYCETDFSLGGGSKKYLQQHRLAVQYIDKFFKPGILASEIDRDALDSFKKCLLEMGFSEKTAQLNYWHVRVVVRRCLPLALPNPRLCSEPDIDWNDETLLRVIFTKRYSPLRLLGKSTSTKSHYRRSLDGLDEFLGRPAKLADLTDETVAGMMGWISEKGLSPRSVNNRRDYILAFWRWCARKRLVDLWPDVDPLPEPDQMPKSWSQDDLAKLFEACINQTGKIAGVPAPDWWSAMHLFLWDSGERTGAMLNLEWEHFDATSSTMYVPGNVRKTGKKALYHLKPQTVAAFELIREPQRKLIFDFEFCLGTFYNRYTRLLKDAGLPHGRRDKPQKMRRSFASHLEAAGGNATDALQHSSRSVTKESYLDERVVKTAAPNLLLFDVALPNRNGDQNGNGKPSEPESTADADESADELPGQR